MLSLVFLERLAVRGCWLTLCVVATWAWAAPAFALSATIVRPANPSPTVAESVTRLHGELLSVGFQVSIRERPPGASERDSASADWLEALVAENGADAVLYLAGDTSQPAVEVWIADPKGRRLEVSRVTLAERSADAPAKLALRALEVLRSRLLEPRLAARAARPREARAEHGDSLPPPLPPAGEQARERFGVELGAAARTSLDGIGPALLPLLRLDWAARPWLVVEATLAGFGTRPSVDGAAGSARVAQQYGLLGACYRWSAHNEFTPLAALSAGFLRTAVDGSAESPREGHALAHWSYLLDASVGAAWRLPSHLSMTLAAHAQFAAPYVSVRFDNEAVASSGRPDLLLTLALGVWQ